MTTTTTLTTPPTSLVSPTEIPDSEMEANFHRYLKLALDIPDDEVVQARVNFTNVVQNAGTGVAALVPYRDLIAKIPNVSLDEIDSIAGIGQAFLYSVTQAERSEPIASDVRARLSSANKVRGELLAKVEVLVTDGIIPESEVVGIRRGKGPIDTAGDCVALAALIRKYATAISGHLKIAAADVQAADVLGAQLLGELRSATAPAKTKELAQAIDARDRLWTLLETTWEQNVWRAGALVFGRNHVEEHVPPLGSRRIAKSEPAPAPTPAPTPAPAPAPVASPSVVTSSK
nr:hypothetical protein [Kofleriaceae bacterium]